MSMYESKMLAGVQYNERSHRISFGLLGYI